MNQPPLKSTASNKASRELQFARSFKLEKLIPFECPGYFAVILTAITLLTLGLRLYRLDSESLYMDEIVTVETFHRDPVGIVLGAAIVGQPPLDNFVGAFVYRLGLGQSDWWVRFPAAVFGTGAVLLLGVWVRRLAGDVAGVTAALLLAVCPLHVYMSQEVRPYSLMFFLALACGLSYVRARERSTAVNWTLFSFVTFAMLMTRWTDPHFIILGIGLHALASRLRTTGADCELREAQASVFRRAALATVAAYACYAPFFCIVLHYHHSTSIRSPSNDWTVRFASLLYEGYAALLAGYSTRTVFHALPGSHWLLIAGGLLALLGLVAALLRRDAAPRDVKVFWWIFVPFPLVYAFVYALLGDAIPKPQYLLVMAIPLFAAAAIGLDAVRNAVCRFHVRSCEPRTSVRADTPPSSRVPRTTKTLAALAYVVPLILMAVSMAQNSWAALERTDKRDWRGAMGFLKERAAPGDVAVCMGSDTVPPAYRPKAYGKDRYGPSHLNFIPVSTDTPLDAFSSADWRPQSNSVWMLVYTDRMYTGVDRVVPPENPSQKSSRAANFSSRGLSGGVIGTVTFGQSHIHAIHSFNGLFLVELPQGRPAIDRLMDTIGEWYTILPAEASIPAPALLRWRYAISRGDAFMAAESLSAARKQCASKADLAALEKIVQSGEAVAKR